MSLSKSHAEIHVSSTILKVDLFLFRFYIIEFFWAAVNVCSVGCKLMCSAYYVVNVHTHLHAITPLLKQFFSSKLSIKETS
jgi:hypothetical protein